MNATLNPPPHRTDANSQRARAVVRCAILDADPFCRLQLSDILARESDVSIVAAFGEQDEFDRMHISAAPHAFFIDARLPAQWVQEVVARFADSRCAIVFLSAVKADAVRAFDDEAMDFLIKPFNRPRVALTLARLRIRMTEQLTPVGLNTDWAAGGWGSADATMASAPSGSTLAVTTHRGVEYVPTSTISSVVCRKQVVVICTSERNVTTNASLFAIEGMLDPTHFVRTHRNALVNLRGVQRLVTCGLRRSELILQSGARVPVSKRRVAAVRRALRAIALALSLCVGASRLNAQASAPASATSRVIELSGIMWRDIGPGLSEAPVEGDASVAGKGYSLLLRLQDGKWIPPHWHPLDKHVVVLSGTMLMGMGDRIDKEHAMVVAAGSIVAVAARDHHYEGARGETVLLLYGTGPLTTNFVRATPQP